MVLVSYVFNSSYLSAQIDLNKTWPKKKQFICLGNL